MNLSNLCILRLKLVVEKNLRQGDWNSKFKISIIKKFHFSTIIFYIILCIYCTSYKLDYFVKGKILYRKRKFQERRREINKTKLIEILEKMDKTIRNKINLPPDHPASNLNANVTARETISITVETSKRQSIRALKIHAHNMGRTTPLK